MNLKSFTTDPLLAHYVTLKSFNYDKVGNGYKY